MFVNVKWTHITALKCTFFCSFLHHIAMWLILCFINTICDLLFAQIYDVAYFVSWHTTIKNVEPLHNLLRDFEIFLSPSLLLMRPHETLMFFVAGLFKSAPTSVPPPKLLKCQAARKIQNRSKICFLFQLLKKLQKVVGLFSSFKHGLGISTWRSNFVLFRQLRGFSLKYFCSHYEKVNNQELLW